MTIKHVHRFKDRHGKIRHYLRLPGVKALPLSGDPGSPEFMKAYNEAVAAYQAPEPDSKSNARPGSMRDLAERYFRSGKYKGKSERTRYIEKRKLERFLIKHGDKRASAVETRHLDAIFGEMSGTPAEAMDLRKRLRNLFRLAIKLGWRKDDPIAATDTFKGGTWHTWTDDEVEAFEKRWSHGTRQRLAFDLLLFTGQRSSDVRRMTWADVRGEQVKVIQAKTRADLMIAQHPALAATLDLDRRDIGTIVVTEFGRPFTEKGFGNWMADAIEKAGLAERCITHGIRKAAARRLAEAGCTAHEIASITGHKTLKEVQRYTEAVERGKLAKAAIKKVAGQGWNTSLANPVRKPSENPTK